MAEGFPILGGGPAGAAAALALRHGGVGAVIYEKSSFPRHKVCGEFFSPEILPALEEIGMAGRFLEQRPARVTHAELHFAKRHRRFALPEPAFGLSRYRFDDLLLRAAVERGAEVRRERPAKLAGPGISAVGRAAAEARGRRIFGFKAHFGGPANDAVELYFFPGGYCGLCAIESGLTNVCGLTAEDRLADGGFEVDVLLGKPPRLAERLQPLARLTRWYLTGPLQFAHRQALDSQLLPAGDAACFVDPFAGSGLLAAIQTGAWAAAALLRGTPEAAREYERQCASFYRRQLSTTTIIRRLLALDWAEPLAGLLPGPLLFRLTRPATM